MSAAVARRLMYSWRWRALRKTSLYGDRRTMVATARMGSFDGMVFFDEASKIPPYVWEAMLQLPEPNDTNTARCRSMPVRGFHRDAGTKKEPRRGGRGSGKGGNVQERPGEASSPSALALY